MQQNSVAVFSITKTKTHIAKNRN